jgi:hypothetical protein
MRLEDQIASIRSRLDDLERIASIRKQIVDVMLACLETHKDTLDDWHKTHFSNAIGALGLNIHSLQQPTSSWLRLCLSDLKKVCWSSTERDPDYRSSDPSMRDVNYEQLLGALDSIGRELG